MGSEGKMEWHYESWRDNYTFPHCERSIEYIENLDRSPHTHVHYNIELLYIIEGNMRLNLYEGNQIFHMYDHSFRCAQGTKGNESRMP